MNTAFIILCGVAVAIIIHVLVSNWYVDRRRSRLKDKEAQLLQQLRENAEKLESLQRDYETLKPNEQAEVDNHIREATAKLWSKDVELLPKAFPRVLGAGYDVDLLQFLLRDPLTTPAPGARWAGGPLGFSRLHHPVVFAALREAADVATAAAAKAALDVPPVRGTGGTRKPVRSAKAAG